MGGVFDPGDIMICVQPDKKFDWLSLIWFGLSNSCDSVWSNVVGQNRETDEEHDGDCIEERFQWARIKYDKDSEVGRKALGVGNCSINI